MPSLPVELMKTAVPAEEVCPKMLADVATVVHVLAISANANNVIGGTNIETGSLAQGGVAASGGVELECVQTRRPCYRCRGV